MDMWNEKNIYTVPPPCNNLFDQFMGPLDNKYNMNIPGINSNSSISITTKASNILESLV